MFFPWYALTWTVKVAQGFIQKALEAGGSIYCPCCGQLIVVAKRRIHNEPARFLIKLVKIAERHPEKEWFHVREVLAKTCERGSTPKASTDAAYLIKWGLLEKNRKKGEYRPTAKGRDFVYGRVRVPVFCYVFNNQEMGFSEELISIQDALDEMFSYEKLMG